MKILFISRSYPPVTGGIENQNAALAEWLPRHAEVTTVANRLGKKFLPFFLPYALLRCVASVDWVVLAGVIPASNPVRAFGPEAAEWEASWVWLCLVHGGGWGSILSRNSLRGHFPSHSCLVHDLWMSGVVDRSIRND